MDRGEITFGQAEGVEPLPRQLALREVSAELTAGLWAMIYASIRETAAFSAMGYDGGPWLGAPWRTILEVWHVTREHKLLDEYSTNLEQGIERVKRLVTSKNYVVVLDFVEFVVRREDCPHGLERAISIVLERTRSAYRLINKSIVPISSDEQAQAVRTALATAAAAKAQGPGAHLRSAAGEVTAGRWADSVRESIHAVEAAAKSIEPEAATLGPALSKLRASINLNPAMGRAFSALYGYSTDEQSGARHAMVFEGHSSITERDAMFMFGACAAFVGYLLSAAPPEAA